LRVRGLDVQGSYVNLAVTPRPAYVNVKSVLYSAPTIRTYPSLDDERVTDMSDNVMTIREMCDAFDVTPRTLRFYEAKELLFPVRVGQKRLFTKRDRARLKLILRGKRFGFSLEEIRQLLDLYDMGDQQQTQLQRTYDLACARLKDMERQRDELDQAIEDLRLQLSWGEKMIQSINTPRRAAE
jgi:DNA-binding transcriptional MerR regulator